ncbi:MAG: hypothetical protein R3C32_13470 [Chloroflexota bacterium]
MRDGFALRAARAAVGRSRSTSPGHRRWPTSHSIEDVIARAGANNDLSGARVSVEAILAAKDADRR